MKVPDPCWIYNCVDCECFLLQWHTGIPKRHDKRECTVLVANTIDHMLNCLLIQNA